MTRCCAQNSVACAYCIRAVVQDEPGVVMAWCDGRFLYASALLADRDLSPSPVVLHGRWMQVIYFGWIYLDPYVLGFFSGIICRVR